MKIKRSDRELISITLPRAAWLVLDTWLVHGGVGYGFGRLTPDDVIAMKTAQALIMDAIRREVRK